MSDDKTKNLADEYARIYNLRLDLMNRSHKISDANLARVLAVIDKLSPADFARVLLYAEGLAEWD